jgi:hypothetical protein
VEQERGTARVFNLLQRNRNIAGYDKSQVSSTNYFLQGRESVPYGGASPVPGYRNDDVARPSAACPVG